MQAPPTPSQASLPRKYPEASNMRIRESINVLARAFYFIHLTLIFVYSTILLIFRQRVRISFTSTLALIIIYGFIIIWLNIFNFICIMCNSKQATKTAIWCNRFIIKIIQMIFPIFALLAYTHEHCLGFDRAVIAWMGYQITVSIGMVLFEIYSCTCGHHEEPGFLYEANQLGIHQDEVVQAMNQMRMRKKQSKELVYKKQQSSTV